MIDSDALDDPRLPGVSLILVLVGAGMMIEASPAVLILVPFLTAALWSLLWLRRRDSSESASRRS